VVVVEVMLMLKECWMHQLELVELVQLV